MVSKLNFTMKIFYLSLVTFVNLNISNIFTAAKISINDIASKQNLEASNQLLEASRISDIDQVRKLVNLDIDVNIKNYYGRSALIWAMINRNIEIAQILIEHKADVNVKYLQSPNTMYEEGIPLLSFCIRVDQPISFIKLLIDSGADINFKDDLGNTPLIYAVKYGRKELVKLLLANNADLTISNCMGETAIDLAREMETVDKEKKDEVIKLLSLELARRKFIFERNENVRNLLGNYRLPEELIAIVKSYFSNELSDLPILLEPIDHESVVTSAAKLPRNKKRNSSKSKCVIN